MSSHVEQIQGQHFQAKGVHDGLVHYPLPKAFIASYHSNEVEPTFYYVAAKHPAWREAMKAEFDALLCNCNGTWTLVPPSPDMNIVGCK